MTTKEDSIHSHRMFARRPKSRAQARQQRAMMTDRSDTASIVSGGAVHVDVASDGHRDYLEGQLRTNLYECLFEALFLWKEKQKMKCGFSWTIQ
jgi:hypothetical protein